MRALISRGLIVLTAFSLVSGAAETLNKINEFEFRGLRTGGTESEIRVLLARIIAAGDAKTFNGHPECLVPPDLPGKLCVAGNYMASLNRSGIVWEIVYHFEDHLDDRVDTFLTALTAKYGKPRIVIKAYTNGFGAQLTGSEYHWQRGTQELLLEEICGTGSEIGKHCINITDTANAPPLALPHI